MLSEVVNFGVRQMDSHGQISGVGSNVRKRSSQVTIHVRSPHQSCTAPYVDRKPTVWLLSSVGEDFAGPLLALSLGRQSILPALSNSVKPHLRGRRDSLIQFMFFAATLSIPTASFLYLYCTLIFPRPDEFLWRNRRNSCRSRLGRAFGQPSRIRSSGGGLSRPICSGPRECVRATAMTLRNGT